MNWRTFVPAAALGAALLTTGCYGGEQSKQGSAARMHNATIAIVTGIAAEQIHGASSIEATIERPLAYDSDIAGTTAPGSIDVRVKLPLFDNRFVAHKENGMWVGTQDKHLFDWDVRQTDARTYQVSRVGFDGKIELDVIGTHIQGKYYKPLGLDFSFDGTMTQDGQYRLTVHRPLAFDWDVTGHVMPLQQELSPPYNE